MTIISEVSELEVCERLCASRKERLQARHEVVTFRTGDDDRIWTVNVKYSKVRTPQEPTRSADIQRCASHHPPCPSGVNPFAISNGGCPGTLPIGSNMSVLVHSDSLPSTGVIARSTVGGVERIAGDPGELGLRNT